MAAVTARSAKPVQGPSGGVSREEASAVMARLARALSDLIAPITRPGGGPIRAVDVARSLELDANLAWQVFRIADAESPLSASAHVPGTVAMGRVFSAATEHGIAPGVVRAAREAHGAFLSFVEEHCGDRAAFDTMFGDGQEDATLWLKHKRAAYRANAHIWGVHASAIVKCVIYNIDANNRLEFAYVRVYAGIRRMRANTPYNLKMDSWQVRKRDNGMWELVRSSSHQPIDPQPETPHGLSLLPEFCSSPMPEISVREEDSGVHRVDVVGRSVGNGSASTCAVGEVLRSVIDWPIPGDDLLGSRLSIEAPAEAAICDVLIPSSISRRETPILSIFKSQTGPEGLVPGREMDKIVAPEEAHYAGMGAAAVRAPEYPAYPRLLEHVCARLGWDCEALDVYRCRVKYPVLHSVIEMNTRTRVAE